MPILSINKYKIIILLVLIVNFNNIIKCELTSDYADDALLCKRPEYPTANLMNITQICSAYNASPSLSDINNEAWKFAPVIHFHPLEQYFMGNVTEYLQIAKVYRTSVGNPNTPLAFAMNGSYPTLLNFTQSDVYLSAIYSGNAFQSGSPFTENGLSTSPIYYRAYKTTSYSIIYDFIAFFPWNGCSNQEILQQQSGVQLLFKFIPCTIGEHEGDFERVTVEVCNDLKTITRISLSQHGHNEQHNCIADECNFINNTHPEVYTALNTHAMYRDAAKSNIYSQIVIAPLSSIKAINLVDRTLKSDKRFVPTISNVIALEPHAIMKSQRYSRETYLSNYTTLPFPWILFGGRYGKWELEPAKANNFQCLTNSQDVFVSCVSHPVLGIAQTLLGVTSSSFRCNSQFGDLIEKIKNILTAAGPRFPLFDSKFPTAYVPPVLENGRTVESIICPNPDILQEHTYDSTPVPIFRPQFAMIVSFGFFGLIVAVVLLILSSIARRLHKKHVPSFYDGIEDETKCKRFMEFADSVPKLNLFGLFVSIGGSTLFFERLPTAMLLLNTYLSSEDTWVQVESTLSFFVPFVVVVQLIYTIFAFFITGKPFEYFCLSKYAKCHHFMKYWGWLCQLFLIMILFLCNLMILAVFGFSVITLVLSLGFVSACDKLETTNDNFSGLCLNLEDFGVSATICGSDLTIMCNDWRSFKQSDIALLIAGSIALNVSTICFLMTSGIHWHRFMVFKQVEPDYEETMIDLQCNDEPTSKYRGNRGRRGSQEDWRNTDLRMSTIRNMPLPVSRSNSQYIETSQLNDIEEFSKVIENRRKLNKAIPTIAEFNKSKNEKNNEGQQQARAKRIPSLATSVPQEDSNSNSNSSYNSLTDIQEGSQNEVEMGELENKNKKNADNTTNNNNNVIDDNSNHNHNTGNRDPKMMLSLSWTKN